MHIKITDPAAELNGRRFAVGTVLDLPEAEAAPLLDAEAAEIIGAEAAADEAEGDGEAKKPASRPARSRK